ncbi:MAG: SDR family NAD(P)-dependent oxidoreductase, partial [Mesorhizobium sp.]
MKRVLVTGGCGFIGRHVAQELVEHGYAVRILDALLEQVHGADAVTMPAGTELIKGDVRDRSAMAEVVSDADAVIHLAAEVGVGQSMYEIARYVATNDLGTATLLEALIKKPVERIVVASSMSIYGEGLYQTPDGRRIDDARRRPADIKNGRWDLLSDAGETLSPIPTDEEKRADLASIYALTKYAQERAVLIFGQAYGVDAVALRLFNVFGAG